MPATDMVEARKQAAVDFLQLVIAGRIEEAYRTHVDMQGKHHNPYFPAGFAALRQAMSEDHRRSPDKRLTVQHVVSDGDLVAVHSHLVPAAGHAGMTVVHIFRFQGERVVELWDIGQLLPEDSPNADGSF